MLTLGHQILSRSYERFRRALGGTAHPMSSQPELARLAHPFSRCWFCKNRCVRTFIDVFSGAETEAVAAETAQTNGGDGERPASKRPASSA